MVYVQQMWQEGNEQRERWQEVRSERCSRPETNQLVSWRALRVVSVLLEKSWRISSGFGASE